MRPLGAVSEGSGAVNEDGFGVIGGDDVSAAWVFDGVTGINARNYLGQGSDARWLVDRAQEHLALLAGQDSSLSDILTQLVDGLIADWENVSCKIDLPEDYDPPAACLVLVKRYGREWKSLRLGDSCLLARHDYGSHRVVAAAPNNDFDRWLSREARKRREGGAFDIKALLAEFRPQLLAGRQKRNRPGGYSILECSTAALLMPEYADLATPAEMLLCTDGYYRAVDHYGLYENETLLDASGKSVERVLYAIRAAESNDPTCERYPRFKPADDATAVMLGL